MQINIKANIDDELRSEIRQLILKEAKAIARNELDKTVREEVKRLLDNMDKAAAGYNYGNLRNTIDGVVRHYLSSRWTDIGAKITETVKTNMGDIVYAKIADSANSIIERSIKTHLRNLFEK